MTTYGNLPEGASANIQPFKAHVDEEKLQHFKKLLELSPIGPATYENTSVGRQYGMQREWLIEAKRVWLETFDWRASEDRINSFPNFKVPVTDNRGNVIDMQFLALFSEKKDAVPIGFFHGWPGSICEFLDMLDLVKERYSPKDLPYHIVVPSLPGYAYSSGLPMDKDYAVDIAAGALENLMIKLGFGSGYLVQGGDLGSFMSRILAMTSESCKGMHVNMMMMPPGEDLTIQTNDGERKAVEKANEFMDTGFGFLLEQGSRPATIGLALSASPLALLSWIGEKYLAWTDEDPPLEKILESVTLYWMTDTFPRCLYHNRAPGKIATDPKMARLSTVAQLTALQLPYIDKPCGYSLFAHEIVPVPESWAVKSCNLVSFNQHDRGGHFPASEKPKELLDDVEEYVRKAWKRI